MQKPLRVLLIEDNPDDAALIQHELEQSLFTLDIQRVDTQVDFLTHLSPDIDVILSDYEVPGFDVLRTLVFLKQHAFDIPFIIVSGAIREEVAVKAVKQGAADYLLKDRLARLGSAVVRALEEKKVRQEKQQAYQALKRSEAFNRAVLRSLTVHIAVLDSEGTIVAVNAAWASFAQENGADERLRAGLGVNYLAVCRHTAAGGEASAFETLAGITSVMEGRKSLFTLEYPCHSPAQQRWFMMHVTPLEEGAGGVVVAHQDITERKQTELALRASEERFFKIFHASPIAIALTAFAEGRILEVNDYFLRLFGFSRDEVIGRSALALGMWHDEQVRDEVLARLQQHEVVNDLEVRFTTRAGTPCHMQGAVEKIDLGGQICLLWMGVDATERKRAEEALKSERAFLDSIVENIPISVFVKDAKDLRYVRYNKAGEDLIGYTRDKLIGKDDYDFFPREEADFFTAKDREVLDKGEMVDIPEEPIHIQHKGTRILHTRKIPVLDEQGQPQYLLGISEDITERKHHEEELIGAKKKAEEMSRLKSTFLANMSHEFRTPLASIIGFAEILATEIPDAQREYAHLIELSGRRLLNTLSSVLDLSMLETGGLKLNCEVFDVAEEVQKKAEVWHLDALQRGLHVETLLPSVEVEALLDRACLDRILHHLVGNAIKFTQQGEIIVVVLAVDDRVEIEVRDTGIGISPAFMPSLFEAFKQESTGTARVYEGAGLGLTVAKRLIELMDGELCVESHKDHGSVFTVSFPRQMTQPAAVPVTAENGMLRPPVRRSSTPVRVLAVDDNPPMLYLLERFLEEIPEVHAFDTAVSDEAALALARKHRYDAVLMDINLGGIRTGEDVMRDLRTMPAYQAVPVVAVTAYVMPEDRERFLQAGFDAYLGKPFTEEQLRDMLIQVLSFQNGGKQETIS